MELFEAIKKRRSIRAFGKGDVSEEAVAKLVEYASYAPSAGNIQPWEFIVVRNLDLKRRLVVAASNQNFVEQAAVVIVVCADQNRSARRYGPRGSELYCLQDTAAAIQNLVLAAHAFKLGTCWVGAFREDQVREALNIPSSVRPIALIPIGPPAETPKARRRRPIKQLIHYETF